ncbi:MAG TPA: hypothetical protein VGH14_20580 [Solirubrobacterales bacterium]
MALLAPGASQAAGSVRPGAVLDPSFGVAGVLRLPSESSFTAHGTSTQSGTLLVSGGSSVQLLNDLGGAGEAFGSIGSLTLPPATGDQFELSGFTIDKQGRLLVVGTSLFPESENPSPFLENGSRAFRPGVLRILRFLPDGDLDPSFGHEGVVETGLGLPAPRGTDGRRLGSHASVVPSGVTVDAQGRIIVTGAAAVRLGEACEHDSFAAAAVDAGFVARFTESGTPDTSFGRNGLFGGHALSENPLGAEGIGEAIVSPGGAITYLSTGAYACDRDRSHFGLAQLTPSGRTRTAFGKKGGIVGSYRAVAGESDGSIVALAEVPRRREKESFTARLIRVAPGGKLDSAFGRGGRATVTLGPGFSTTLDSLAIDGRRRVIIGGTLGTPKGRSIVLLRVSGHGIWEKNFGPHGRVATRERQLGQYGSSDLFFDPEGRLVTVHQYAEENGRSGLVVARYLPRN